MLILISSLTACFSSDPFSEGNGYRVLKSASKSKSPQIVLFFSPACPHCFKFEKTFEHWVKNKPDNVAVERIPVYFDNKSWEPLRKAYSTMRVLGIHNEHSLDLLSAIQEKGIYLGDAQAVAQWLSTLGYEKNDVINAYNSQNAQSFLDAFYASEKKYNVRSIPRLIINGVYDVNLRKIEGETDEEKIINLHALIDYILKLS